MKSSEQLELETEQARARVNDKLEELRARATPGQLVDQLIDYARDSGGAQFFTNLGRQVVDNPMPVALLGLGVAWLALATSKQSARGALPSLEPELRQARERASAVGEQLGERASAMGDRIANAAGTAGGAVRDAVHTAVDRGQGFVALCRDQPVLLAGLGVAIGATLGALLPTSSTENRLMGEASDDLKAGARDLADKVKDGIESTLQHTNDAVGAPPQTQPACEPSSTDNPDRLAPGRS